MAFTIYRSTDGSAPSLTGQTGALVTVLDAILVNGYGAKAAAGWSKSYSGTSKAVYRAPSGAQLYYRVQDDGPGAGTYKEARITGYETMSDVDTGTGPFPTAAQGVGGVAMFVCRKSASADATARAWVCAADARTVYLFVSTGDSAGYYMSIMFGEFYSLLPGDAYNGIVIGRKAENSSSTSNDCICTVDNSISTAVTNSRAVARGHTGLGGSVLVSMCGDYWAGQNGYNSGVIPFTNPADGGIYIHRLWIGDPTTAPAYGIRGRYRGFWGNPHPVASYTDGDTFSGTGDLAGRTFLVLKYTLPSSSVAIIETSDTLETN